MAAGFGASTGGGVDQDGFLDAGELGQQFPDGEVEAGVCCLPAHEVSELQGEDAAVDDTTRTLPKIELARKVGLDRLVRDAPSDFVRNDPVAGHIFALTETAIYGRRIGTDGLREELRRLYDRLHPVVTAFRTDEVTRTYCATGSAPTSSAPAWSPSPNCSATPTWTPSESAPCPPTPTSMPPSPSSPSTADCSAARRPRGGCPHVRRREATDRQRPSAAAFRIARRGLDHLKPSRGQHEWAQIAAQFMAGPTRRPARGAVARHPPRRRPPTPGRHAGTPGRAHRVGLERLPQRAGCGAGTRGPARAAPDRAGPVGTVSWPPIKPRVAARSRRMGIEECSA